MYALVALGYILLVQLQSWSQIFNFYTINSSKVRRIIGVNLRSNVVSVCCLTIKARIPPSPP